MILRVIRCSGWRSIFHQYSLLNTLSRSLLQLAVVYLEVVIISPLITQTAIL